MIQFDISMHRNMKNNKSGCHISLYTVAFLYVAGET